MSYTYDHKEDICVTDRAREAALAEVRSWHEDKTALIGSPYSPRGIWVQLAINSAVKEALSKKAAPATGLAVEEVE